MFLKIHNWFRSLDHAFRSALLFGAGVILAWLLFVGIVALAGGASPEAAEITVTAGSTAIKIGSEASFQLPSSYTVKTEKFQGSEVEYHLDIRRKDGLIYGYFQVLNPQTELTSTEELEHYLSNAEQYKSAQIMSFRSEKKAVGNSDGIVWTYITRVYDENGKATDIFARQAFAVKNNKIYTLALFAHSDKITEAELNSDFYKTLSTLSI